MSTEFLESGDYNVTEDPPAEGWWPTGEREYRWWHGTFWSVAADRECNEAQAEFLKTIPAGTTEIVWRPWRPGETDPLPEMPNADLF